MAKWLKKNWTNILLVVIVLAGLCLLLYPSFSDWWNSMHQSRAIAAYVETVDAMSQEDIDKILTAAREYNERLWHKANRWVLSDEEQAEYESMLDVSGNGIMGYINIPVIGVNLPIYHGTGEAVLQVATGHLSATSLPVGGPGTHAAISGHRGLPSARLFTDLDQLKVGDIFTVSVLNEVYTYQIEQIVTVVPEDTSQMNLYQGEDLCTLQTCTPQAAAARTAHRGCGRRADGGVGGCARAELYRDTRRGHTNPVPLAGGGADLFPPPQAKDNAG